MDKKALRAEIRAKKRALTEEQIVRYSEELAQKLFAHPLYQAAKSIYGYMSYNQEVRTMPILRQAQADGKRVAVPKVYGDEIKAKRQFESFKKCTDVYKRAYERHKSFDKLVVSAK